MAYLTGRKRDDIWYEFDEVFFSGNPKRAKCIIVA